LNFHLAEAVYISMYGQGQEMGFARKDETVFYEHRIEIYNDAVTCCIRQPDAHVAGDRKPRSLPALIRYIDGVDAVVKIFPAF